MNKIVVSSFILLCFSLVSCIKETDTEIERPKIELLSPTPCDTLYYGESFDYHVKITDNTGLGNISMDIHNNFGHHNHGVHESCNMDAAKDPVSPYSNSWIFSLPENETEYTFKSSIDLPNMKDDSTFYDTGDYHFHFYITDNEGYQSFTTMDVKVLVR